MGEGERKGGRSEELSQLKTTTSFICKSLKLSVCSVANAIHSLFQSLCELRNSVNLRFYHDSKLMRYKLARMTLKSHLPNSNIHQNRGTILKNSLFCQTIRNTEIWNLELRVNW